jgi:hypothetical protein
MNNAEQIVALGNRHGVLQLSLEKLIHDSVSDPIAHNTLAFKAGNAAITARLVLAAAESARTQLRFSIRDELIDTKGLKPTPAEDEAKRDVRYITAGQEVADLQALADRSQLIYDIAFQRAGILGGASFLAQTILDAPLNVPASVVKTDAL